MITLYEFRSSPYCEKVRLVMDLKGLEYDAVEINGLTRQELRGVSLYPTVPIIRDGLHVVEDSTRVLEYLEETYPDPPLVPKDPQQKTQVWLWEDWADESWGFDARAIGLWSIRHDPKRFREDVTRNLPGWTDVLWPVLGPIVIRVALKQCGINTRTEPVRRKKLVAGFALLAEALKDREWLVGEQMTIADAVVAGHLWELRHTEQYARTPECAPVYALRDRVYHAANARRNPKSAA